jgi:rare lipoprotein A
MSGIAQSSGVHTNRSLRFCLGAGALACAALWGAGTHQRSGSAVSAPTRVIASADHQSTKQAAVAASAHSGPALHSEGRRRWFEFGRASWYGSGFQGQPTASGEDYDMNALTCAHPYLPLGALVRVTNLRNHRSVIVKVNDRGPMVQSRIVDLSWRAARLLGFSRRGTASVRIDLLDPKPTRAEIAQLLYPEQP